MNYKLFSPSDVIVNGVAAKDQAAAEHLAFSSFVKARHVFELVFLYRLKVGDTLNSAKRPYLIISSARQVTEIIVRMKFKGAHVSIRA